MRKTFLTTTAFGALIFTASTAIPAYASDTNIEHSYNCNGNGSCDNSTTNNNEYDNEGGEGGQGGDGGDGGNGGAGGNATNTNTNTNTATGGAGGDGGDATNTNTSTNTSTNTNANVANGGDAEAKAEVKDSGNSYNKNKNTNNNDNSNHNRNSNKQGQAQGQKQGQIQGQAQGQSQEVNNSGNSSVNINNPRQPVNTAYSAGLTSGEDTCMGSSSIGAQAVSFGLTLGTTWTDDNCRRLKNSRQLVALGYGRAATALMCVDEDVKNAMDAAGTPCPGSEKQAAYFAPVQIAEAAPAREYVPMAPVADDKPVRHRRHKKALPPK